MSILRALMALLLAFLLALCGRDANAERTRDPGSDARPRFLYPGLEGALASIPWKALGHDLAALHPLLDRQARAFRTGSKSGSLEGLATLQRAVRARIEPIVADRSLSGGASFSGTGLHGVFTHPALLVNAIHFTLDEVNKPLTMEQAEELFHLGRQFVAKERLRVEGARDESLALARLLEEMRLRSEMLGWARVTLTPKQQLVLRPKSTRDLVGWSYFTGASVLSTQAQPVAYVDRADLVEVLARWHAGRFGFGESELSVVRAHLAKFVANLPAEPALQKRGVLSASFTVKMAEMTVGLRRALLAEESFSWAQRDRIRRELRFCVPVRVAAPLR